MSDALEPIRLKDVRQQIEVLKIAERFFDSFLLFTLFDLGVFRILADGSRSLDQLTEVLGGSRETLEAILDAAVAIGVLAREGSHYSADDPLLDGLGREDSPAYLGEWIAFLQALAGPLLELPEAQRSGTTPGALFEEMGGDTLPARRMTRAMDAYARSRGIELAVRVDFSRTRTLLDLGCGPGTYSLSIVARNPDLQATLLDLEGPIAEARRIADSRGMSDRVRFVACNALDYHPEEPFDDVLISNTLHMLGPDLSRSLLRHCYDLVRPGGRLLVQAQYLDDDRTSPRWPTLLNLIQRVATPTGRNHAIGETREWLAEAGFGRVDYEPLSAWNVNRVLIAHRDDDAS